MNKVEITGTRIKVAQPTKFDVACVIIAEARDIRQDLKTLRANPVTLNEINNTLSGMRGERIFAKDVKIETLAGIDVEYDEKVAVETIEIECENGDVIWGNCENILKLIK